VKKCPYCDFNSHESRTPIDFVGYVDALLDDLKTQLSFVQGRKISAIFIGGGTPSLLPTDRLAALIERIRDRFGLTSIVYREYTPTRSADRHRPEAHFRRLSILSPAVDSHECDVLRGLNRLHIERR
jgi:oxygen-independent coproporphyrinogen-3 oxidase